MFTLPAVADKAAGVISQSDAGDGMCVDVRAVVHGCVSHLGL